MAVPSERCEARERIEDWPYVRRCIGRTEHPHIWVSALNEFLDLCSDHYQQVVTGGG